MALQQKIKVTGNSMVQTSYGAIENGEDTVSFFAYIKVLSVSGDKTSVLANVEFKSDKTTATKRYTVPVSVADGAPNYIKQVYEYLKTLPEFAGSVDC